MREITSSSNAVLKLYRSALKEGRTREGWLAVEGPLLVEEALNAASPESQPEGLTSTSTLRGVVATPAAARKFAALLERVPRDAEQVSVSDRLFSSIAQTVTPQGIAALVEVQPPPLDAVLDLPDAVSVVACGLQDPGNLGTILRTAEALRAASVICLKSTVSPSNPKVVRACGGAIFRLPIFSGVEANPLFKSMRHCGVRIVAANRESCLRLQDANLLGAVAFLIGNEAAGLSSELLSNANVSLSIPISAKVDSLNVAIAAGIFLYEAARQRGFRQQPKAL
ncbi:MAG TPA: RNA methyltransferase [Terriglobia bacterium]|nr:RNA methyltransferase [Terriglobia bacterium]